MGRRALWIGTIVVMLTSAGLAQATKWSDPYDQALAAIKSKKWQQAVDNLNKAIAADPRAQAQKYLDGTFSEDYFPYYYLGLAYENLGEPKKALDNFIKAQQTKMSTALMQALQLHMGEAQAALAAQNQPNPPPVEPPVKPPTPTSETPRPELPKPVETDPKFLSAEQQAEASLAAKKYADAVQQFTSLKAMDATEFAKRGLAAKADEATRGLAADTAAGLVTQGNQLLAAGNLNEAEAKFRGATGISAQTPGAQAGLTEVSRQRVLRANAAVQLAATARSHSQQLLQSGRDLAAQHKYAEADAQYQAAVDADKTNSEAVEQLESIRGYATLVSEGKTLFVQGKLEEARAPLRDAQSLDSARFSDEGLDKTLADLDRRLARALAPAPGVAAAGGSMAPRSGAAAAPNGTAGSNSAAPPLQDALVAYLKGDMNQAIHLLQPLAANDKGYDASGRAAVHAYLGVAYATSSLEAHTDRDSSAWRQKAMIEFQEAQAAQPGYTLSQRIISPKIQAMLDEARRNR